MTDYKRLTEKMGGIYITNCDNCPSIALCDDNNCCDDVMIQRLGELEDKIERGELVLKKEVLKEFAEKVKVHAERCYEWDIAKIVNAEINNVIKEYEK